MLADAPVSRFVRFLLAGAVNTLFGFAVYSAAILLDAPTWAALLIGTLAGIAFNFFTVGGYVFRELSARRLPRFIGAYLLVYAVNLGLIGWLSALLHGKIVAQLVLVAPMALFSYVLMARFVFVGKPKARSAGENA
jgi:putative flippase GtrA